MASYKHRPPDDEYWVPPWSSILFSGDVFQAVPFTQPPTNLVADDDDRTQHFLGDIDWGYGLLITPTCDMVQEVSTAPELAHPFRVLVPILPLAEIEKRTTVGANPNLLRSRDSLHAYMYLPGLPEHFEESAACLFRPTTVDDDFLRDPPRRIAQMHSEAHRHLKVKLGAYWARARINPDELPLQERDEEKAVGSGLSPYDAPT